MKTFQKIFGQIRWMRVRMANGCCLISRRSERRMFMITAVCMGIMVIHHISSRPSALDHKARELTSPDHHSSQQRNAPYDTTRNSLRALNPVGRVTALKPFEVGIHQTDTYSKQFLPTQGATQQIKPVTRELDPSQGTAQHVNKDLMSAIKERIILPSKLIIIPAVIDKGYLDLAVNFFLGSINRLNLTRYTLFMCVHKESCEEATSMGLPTFLYEVNVTETVGDFNTKAFVQKAMVKHRIVRDIISMGFSVLLCDLDMFWLRSPVEHVQLMCEENCDFAVQREADIGLNSGFMYVKPTEGSRIFYENLVQESLTTTKDDQTLFNTFASSHSSKGILHYLPLPSDNYPDGSTYWTKGNRTHPPGTPCPQCLVVHNNWIVSTEAKIFRFKEHLMWFFDKEGYYSNPNRKYITYKNPLPNRFWLKRPPSPPSEEYLALKSAIGIAIATNRTLILPAEFHVWRDIEPLNGVILMRYFDHNFKDLYRESTFLINKKVPVSVKQNHCKGFHIKNNFTQAHPETSNTSRIIFKPADGLNGATSSEVSGWLSLYDKCSVVEFTSLYKAFKGFTDPTTNTNFNKRVELAFEHGFYDQGRVLRGPPLQPVPTV